MLGEVQPPQPLDAVRSVITWHDEAHRKAVLGRQRRAVQLVGKQDVAGGQAFQRQILDVPVAGRSRKLTAVEPIRPEEPRSRIALELTQQRGEIDAAPTDIGDAACRLGRRERVADALMRCLHQTFGTRLQVVESEGLAPAHQPVDDERPLRRIDARDAEVGEDEEILRSGHGIRHLVRAQLHPTKAAGGVHARPVRAGLAEKVGHAAASSCRCAGSDFRLRVSTSKPATRR